ncbi:pyridoxal phosphate-dependent aminotransferase [Xylophilus rhododendri]|uniref:Pyridoxal phosphate-dependent aminotransferase n=1 Tax=Xylophilus rhododendri TaxID=2697032 RepID=A0A857JEX8_9BURK|nr:pyridoxal phosphate-dependent aminotransferase [Xylophilus rhododendri]QHJ01349.1 pyridoxal phosphate-dependent aminotransferase [Xylophilus rhododendri]
MRLSGRAGRATPFYVMEVAKAAAARAAELARAGSDKPMIFLNVGEPDFTAPPLVQEAAARAVRDGVTQYTPALGIMPLREHISRWYAERFGVDVPARRIVITAGASAALQLACLALIDAGDEILMPDPSYPCNRQFVSAAEGRAVLLPTTAADRYQLSADQVEAAWGPDTRGVLLASPSNPTGTSIAPQELRRIHEVVRERGGVLLLDEIYLGLSYDEAFGQSALALPGAQDDIVSINSFSKYFHMTGWRLGWMVVPDALVPVIDQLAAHLFICPSTVAQHAALACFEPDSIAEYERRRGAFKARRDFFVPALAAAGLPVPVMPDGAFYAWADCSEACRRLGVADSWELSFTLMEQANLAVTPGRDFGDAGTAQRIRFSTANSMAQLQEAAARLAALLA